MKMYIKAPVRVDFGGSWTDVSPYRDEFGGETLNAAITHYVEGGIVIEEDFRVSYGPKGIPMGAGLGTSGAVSVVLVTLSKGYKQFLEGVREEIAEKAYEFEEGIVGRRGGKQDQYASVFGGVNLFHFVGDYVGRERLQLPKETVETLEDRLVLCYSGKSRLSSNIHEKVWSNYRKGKKGVKGALHDMKYMAEAMREVLMSNDLDEFGLLLSRHWELQKILDESVTNKGLDGLFEVAEKNGALGGKACGAGGGGCLLFYTHDKPRLEDALRNALPENGKIIPFKFDFDGLTICQE